MLKLNIGLINSNNINKNTWDEFRVFLFFMEVGILANRAEEIIKHLKYELSQEMGLQPRSDQLEREKNYKK